MDNSLKVRIAVELAADFEASQYGWSTWESGLQPTERADLEMVGLDAVKAASEIMAAARLVAKVGVGESRRLRAEIADALAG